MDISSWKPTLKVDGEIPAIHMSGPDECSGRKCASCFNSLDPGDRLCSECGSVVDSDSSGRSGISVPDLVPMPPSEQPEAATAVGDSKPPYTSLSWYHPVATRKSAESLLMQNGQDGSYLLRPSSEKGELALSIRNKDSVKHAKVLYDGSQYKISSYSFTCVEDFVSHFQNEPIIAEDSGIITGLKYPCMRRDFEMAYEKLKVQPASFNVKSTDGYMTKLGGFVKNWKRRWFVLDEEQLSYYRHRSDAQPIRTLDLNECRGCEPDREIGKQNGFKLIFNWRTFHFVCDNETEMKEWMGVLQRKLWNIEHR